MGEKAGPDELRELVLVAVEDVDIYFARDAVHATIGTELPIGQLDVGLILAVAGYPDVVFLLDIRSVFHVAVDEHLTDIDCGTACG